MRVILAITSYLFFLHSAVVFAQVKADFTGSPIQGCSPLRVTFKNNSTGSNLRYLWTFGNGNVSTRQNPEVIYHQPGKYTVSLQVTDTAGNTHTETKTDYITVFKNPEANLSADVSSGCSPLTVNFKEKVVLGDAPIASYIWDFGDGNTSTSANPTHTYTLQGKMNVSLVIIDKNGCEHKISLPAVEVSRTPKVDIAADNQYNCTAPFTVNFSDKSDFTKSGDTYLWDFGDGKTSTAKNPSHTYNSKGKFTVSLTITTPGGCKVTKVFDDYIFIGQYTLGFNASEIFACIGQRINFSNTSVPLQGKFVWDFGDGNTLNGTNAFHSYAKEGKYTIKLKVGVGTACETVLEKKLHIEIVSDALPDFSLNDTFSCKVPFDFLAKNESKNSSNIKWVYNGDTLSGQILERTITQFGEHRIKIVVENSLGCKFVKEKTIRIEQPKVTLSADVLQGCKPLLVNFSTSDSANKEVVKRVFDFGPKYGKKEETGHTTSFTFPDTGVFIVKVTSYTKEGCESTATIKIKVGQKLNPDFKFKLEGDSVCNGTNLLFESTILAQEPRITQMQWSVIKMGKNPKVIENYLITPPYKENPYPMSLGHYKYTTDHDSGWYAVQLIVEHLGCPDTITKDSQFYLKHPWTILSNLYYDPCTDTVAYFYSQSIGYDSLIWTVYTNKGSYSEFGDTVKINKKSGDVRVVLSTTNFKTKCTHSKFFDVIWAKTVLSKITIDGSTCAPSSVEFKGEFISTETALLQRIKPNWMINDETVNFDYKFSRIFTKPGKYKIRFFPIFLNNETLICLEMADTTIEITGPTVEGEVSYTKTCPPMKVTLDCKVDPQDFDSLYWLIEGRKVIIKSIGEIDEKIFAAGSGKQTIELVGVDSNGCTDRTPFTVEVLGPLTPKINILRFAGCESRRFTFEVDAANIDEKLYTYEWDFGNGTKSNLPIGLVTFAETKKYTVSLKISDKNGCASTILTELDLKSENLKASFTADNKAIDCPPMFVKFKDLSIAPNRYIKKWWWDFGDGTNSEEKNPQKLYIKAGKFKVKLNIEDVWGCKDSFEIPDFILVNGPEGEYDFDKKQGCVPLTVNFSSKTKNTNKYEWDMGDGTVVENQVNYTHIYKIPGRFIPLLILSDTLGCSYTLPPIDTIYVQDAPKPDFLTTGSCILEEIEFSAINRNKNIAVSNYKWKVSEGGLPTEYKDSVIYHKFLANRTPKVDLQMSTSFGCKAQIQKQLNLSGIAAKFSTQNNQNCVGSMIQLYNESESDYPIKNWYWVIDKDTFYDEAPLFKANRIGIIPVMLYVENLLRCKNTLNGGELIVGDTIPPASVDMLRVTVNNDNEIQLDVTPSPMADFKSYQFFLNDAQPRKIGEISNRNTTSVVYNQLSTLHESHCFYVKVENGCGLLSAHDVDNTHCTIETNAKGIINANLVNWNEYSGWKEGVTQYNIYRKLKEEATDFAFLATVKDTTSYVDKSVVCNVEYVYLIEGVELNGNKQVSFSDTAIAKPIWENQMPPNKLIRATVEDNEDVLVEWTRIPQHNIPIVSYILQKSIDGDNYATISTTDSGTFNFLDKVVEVQDRSYFYQIAATDACEDTSAFVSFGKTILLQADTAGDQRPFLHWSTYKGWTEPVSYYDIEIKNPDGTFTSIGTTNKIDSTLVDELTNLNQRPNYCYRVTGYKEIINGEPQVVSVSNEDCSPVKSRIYYPNAFTPNNDFLNDFYGTPAQYIKDFHLKIFNRWGELVFESFDIDYKWDGEFLGQPAQQTAYVVIVESVGVDLIKRTHFGTVTLLR